MEIPPYTLIQKAVCKVTENPLMPTKAAKRPNLGRVASVIRDFEWAAQNPAM